jgi:hypothetical protein
VATGALRVDLRSTMLRASTVGVPSRERPDLALVDPGHPETSYLFLKIAAGPPTTSGERMPKGATLTDAQIDSLRSWIASGAR